MHARELPAVSTRITGLEDFFRSHSKPGTSNSRATTSERARDLKQPGVAVCAVAQAAAADQEQMTSFYREEFAAIPEMEIAAKNCYAMSGLNADDIDAAVIYNTFSPNVPPTHMAAS